MITFNRQEIIDNYQYIYKKRNEIEKIADDMVEKGFDYLFFTSSGGSMAMMDPFVFYLNQLSDIKTEGMLSADYLILDNRKISDKTIAFLTSKSGDTKETVDAAKKLKEKGVRIFSAVGVEDSVLESLSDDCVVYKSGRPQELIFYILIFRIMNKMGYFEDYEDFIDNLEKLGEDLADVRIAADEKCIDYARKYCKEPYNIWIGSGDLWPTTYSYSMCVLEESQWIRTKSVRSPEFFHGTIELVEDDVCVTLVTGEGPTRAQDERVKNFVEKYSSKFTCFDTKDYDMPHIKEKYRQYLSPVVMNAVLQRISKNIEVITDHSLDIRRYYRKLEY
ncbi:MAG: SIS domain-containing protein [Erysipelotrichaceae bacterium]|nr:SIS domain-containing protein [Erysipelotrichaceae bacterium]